MAPFAFLDHPGPIAFAHRGGSLEAPENTAASFLHAYELGYRYIETDVHVTTDGVVAVIHDPDLDRTADRPGHVPAMTWAQVSAARLPGDQRVMRIDEVLEEWPDVRFNIDTKHDAVVEPLAEVLRRTGAIERVCITSFSDRRVARMRRLLGPSLCTAAGPRGTAALRLASAAPGTGVAAALVRPAWSGCAAAQVPTSQGPVPIVEPRFIAWCHRAGLAVHVWTIDDRGEMDRLLDLGVDGIMTDRPAVLKELLEARGQWVGRP
ncbi:MAG TPA: glycerophosphodiester phosphodiesterase [Acidimicrobiales bacterium]|nr:glycerophosphodiester phosphodiesterase [Acidimicrobiales bacterium]